MDINHEIIKVQAALKVPVSNLVFKDKEVIVISGKQNIGSIPYYTVAGIIKYDINETTLNWLNWQYVYDQNKNEIDYQVTLLIGSTDIIIGYGKFSYMYVRNTREDLICRVKCIYEGNNWKIERA